MRWKDLRRSSNVRDVRGAGGFGGGRMGLPIGRRGGLGGGVGLLVILVVLFLFGGPDAILQLFSGGAGAPSSDQGRPLTADDEVSDFVARVEKEAGGKDKPVIVYCASRQCNSSEKAAEKLENAGFTQILDYAGGFKAWQEETAEIAECHSC